MELIRKTKTTTTKNGNKIYWAIFKCPFCLCEVERTLQHGKKQKSCGCDKGKGNKYGFKHGGTGTRLYKIWDNLKSRSFNVNNKDYKYYGDRGITICPEWTDKLNGFINFRDWSLNTGYQEDLEIDRKDTDGNYEPNNCRWITHKENCNNRRRKEPTKLILEINKIVKYLYNTGKYTQKELADKYKLSQMTISNIINNKYRGEF